jgi:hypothetical protein
MRLDFAFSSIKIYNNQKIFSPENDIKIAKV